MGQIGTTALLAGKEIGEAFYKKAKLKASIAHSAAEVKIKNLYAQAVEQELGTAAGYGVLAGKDISPFMKRETEREKTEAGFLKQERQFQYELGKIEAKGKSQIQNKFYAPEYFEENVKNYDRQAEAIYSNAVKTGDPTQLAAANEMVNGVFKARDHYVNAFFSIDKNVNKIAERFDNLTSAEKMAFTAMQDDFTKKLLGKESFFDSEKEEFSRFTESQNFSDELKSVLGDVKQEKGMLQALEKEGVNIEEPVSMKKLNALTTTGLQIGEFTANSVRNLYAADIEELKNIITSESSVIGPLEKRIAIGLLRWRIMDSILGRFKGREKRKKEFRGFRPPPLPAAKY